LKEFSRNFKNIRICNENDFERVDYVSNFEAIPEDNYDQCIDNYEGMIITNSQNNLISDNLLFMIKECDPRNAEGIICASSDEIKNKTKYMSITPNFLTMQIDFQSDQSDILAENNQMQKYLIPNDNLIVPT
jgi:hypothetical protein